MLCFWGTFKDKSKVCRAFYFFKILISEVQITCRRNKQLNGFQSVYIFSLFSSFTNTGMRKIIYFTIWLIFSWELAGKFWVQDTIMSICAFEEPYVQYSCKRFYYNDPCGFKFQNRSHHTGTRSGTSWPIITHTQVKVINGHFYSHWIISKSVGNL